MRVRRLILLLSLAAVVPLCQARTAADIRVEILQEEVMLKLCAKNLADAEFEIANVKSITAQNYSAYSEQGKNEFARKLTALRQDVAKCKACIAARQKRIDALRLEMEKFPLPPASALPEHRSVKAKCDEVSATAAALAARGIKAEFDLGEVAKRPELKRAPR